MVIQSYGEDFVQLHKYRLLLFNNARRIIYGFAIGLVHILRAKMQGQYLGD